jgi:hypothetical protein
VTRQVVRDIRLESYVCRGTQKGKKKLNNLVQIVPLILEYDITRPSDLMVLTSRGANFYRLASICAAQHLRV